MFNNNQMFGKAYRFTVGTKVECRTGPQEWSAGEIAALSYSEPDWPRGKTVPYQVQLDDGRLIFVPIDNDQLCRKLIPPWWDSCLSKPGSYFAKNNPPAEFLVKEIGQKNVDDRNHQGNTALMEAVKKKWTNGVSQLIGMKADVNLAANDKTRAIHIATEHGIDMLKLLVDGKADLNVQDEDPDFDPEFTSKTFGDRFEHRTPLHYLCSEGDTAAAKLLIGAGAKLDIQDAQLMTPLHLAIDAEQNDCIDLLLKSGADVNLGNYSSGVDNSPLMDAAFVGNVELMKKLIAAKADINKQGKQDMSALHLAARKKHAEAAACLLEAGADMNLESKVGTALTLARKNGGLELLKVFGVQTESAFTGDAGDVKNVSSLDAAQRAALFLE